MRVIAKRTLKEFWKAHAIAEQPLKAWYDEVKNEKWASPADIKKLYPSASIIAGNRVVFNIKGNTYRLVVKIEYRIGIIWIRFIGTHAMYDKIDVETI